MSPKLERARRLTVQPIPISAVVREEWLARLVAKAVAPPDTKCVRVYAPIANKEYSNILHTADHPVHHVRVSIEIVDQ